jgi:hypothetical protein
MFFFPELADRYADTLLGVFRFFGRPAAVEAWNLTLGHLSSFAHAAGHSSGPLWLLADERSSDRKHGSGTPSTRKISYGFLANVPKLKAERLLEGPLMWSMVT